MAGGGAEDGAEAAVELALRKAAHLGHLGAAEGGFGLAVHVFDHFGEAGFATGTAADLIQSATDTSDADDLAFRVSQRQFAGHDEARRAFGLGGAFDAVHDGLAAAHDSLVVLAILGGATSREEIEVGFADGVLLTLHTAVFPAAAVQRHEAPGAVFDEEVHVRQQIEEAHELAAAGLTQKGLW